MVIVCVPWRIRWQAARSACVFSALPGDPKILTPWPEGKVLLFPRVEGDDLSMRVAGSPCELMRGTFGILSPAADAPERPWDIVLVPGIAFDRAGGRLGRGRGFYDRFLARHSDATRVGICFDEQLVANVPREAHDLYLHAVITPSGIFLAERGPELGPYTKRMA